MPSTDVSTGEKKVTKKDLQDKQEHNGGFMKAVAASELLARC